MDVVRIPDLAAGLAVLALGVWVLALDWRKRLHQSFALLMLVVGTHFVGLGFTEQSEDAGASLMALGLLATPFAALDFALLFQHSHRPPDDAPRRPPSRATRGLLLIGAVAAMGSFLLRPELFYAAEGPLGLADHVRSLVLAGLSAAVGLQALHSQGQRRDALLLFSTGFALHPAFFATTRLANVFPLEAPLSAYTVVETVLACLAVIALLSLGIGLALAARPMDARTRFASRLALGAIMLAVMSAGLILLLPDSVFRPYAIATGAAWELAFAAVAAYAVLRYCLFSLDPRFTRIVREGGTAAIIGFAFFVAENTLQNSLQGSLPATSWGDSVPALGAGAIAAVGLWPVHRLCARFARRVGGPGHGAVRRGLEIYRAAFLAATQDGTIDERERRVLERLAAELRLTPDDRQTVEATRVHAAGVPA